MFINLANISNSRLYKDYVPKNCCFILGRNLYFFFIMDNFKNLLEKQCDAPRELSFRYSIAEFVLLF